MTPKIAMLAVAAILLSGCATLRGGIVGDEREDVRPFATATIEMLTISPIEFRKSKLVYLRNYYESNPELMKRLSDILWQVMDYRDDIIDYSVELVRISDTFPTDVEKCQALGDVLAERSELEIVHDSRLTSEQLMAAAETLHGSDDFLACLRELQPLIAHSGESFEKLIAEAEDEVVPAVVAEFDRDIEAAFATVIAQQAIVYERRDELFGGLQAIRAYRKGDRDALSAFNDMTLLRGTSYALPSSPTESQLERTKDYLIEQLQKEQEILALLEQDRQDYIATRIELETESEEILDSLDLSRRQVVAWIRAHQGLANGVRDPGRWLKGLAQVANAYRQAR